MLLDDLRVPVDVLPDFGKGIVELGNVSELRLPPFTGFVAALISHKYLN